MNSLLIVETALFKLCTFAFIAALLISCTSTNLPPTEMTSEEIEQANTIILFVDETPETAYRQFAQHLMDKGFAFSSTDNSLLTISTEPNDLGYGSHTISMNVSIREFETTAIVISGNLHSNYLGTRRILNFGSSSTIYYASWESLKSISSEFPHTDLKFRRN